MIYVAESMLEIEIDQDSMDVSGVALAGQQGISYDYLRGLYDSGDRLYVPIYPGAHDVAILVNGTWADGVLADIQQFPHSARMTNAENAATAYAFSNDMGFTVSRVSDRIAAFADNAGSMQIELVNAKASGSAGFPIKPFYSGNWIPPGAPDTEECFVHDRCGAWANSGAHANITSVYWGGLEWLIPRYSSDLQQIMDAQGPLTVYVSAYVNGEWVKGQTIFESTDATIAQNASYESRFGQYQLTQK